MDKAVILVSGGINSAVAAAAARDQYDLAMLHVAWGHRAAERERDAFQQIAAALRPEHTLVIDLAPITLRGGNARVNRRAAVEDAATLTGATPATFALGVMPAMLAAAAALAGSLGAARILIGTSEDHQIGLPPHGQLYPDCRREFISAFNLMLHYAKTPHQPLLVEAPLIDMGRPDVIRLGDQLRVPFEKTWSCFRDNDTPCGRCLPCVTRAAGFLRAGIPDPLSLTTAGAA